MERHEIAELGLFHQLTTTNNFYLPLFDLLQESLPTIEIDFKKFFDLMVTKRFTVFDYYIDVNESLNVDGITFVYLKHPSRLDGQKVTTSLLDYLSKLPNKSSVMIELEYLVDEIPKIMNELKKQMIVEFQNTYELYVSEYE